jgi:isoleucyl-tRNA synthetase
MNNENIVKEELAEIRRFDENKIYDKIVDKSKSQPNKLSCDGPPFPNSKSLHHGHILISNIKDCLFRYGNMNGYNCFNKMGYDCHGLPIEMVINEELNITTHEQVEKLTIVKYNETCRKKIESFSKSWDPIFKRIGRLVDPNNIYKTLDTDVMESVWWAFKQLWEKDLIYSAYEVMPYSIKAGTTLSNFEASQNYKIIESDSIFVKFPLKKDTNYIFVAWTTTPWTLPSNMALCVNPESTYVILTTNDCKKYIVAESCVKNLNLNYIRKECIGKGKNLENIHYIPPFNYVDQKDFKIVCGDFVTTVDQETKKSVGTGIVHISPAHGIDDYKVCLENKIITKENVHKYCFVDKNGKFTEEVKLFCNLEVFEANPLIIGHLQEKNIIYGEPQKYNHKYPICYRTNYPLIYKAEFCYFVKVTQLKDKLLKINEEIQWVPEYIGTGKFKNWLLQTKDWCISRSRFFGTPIPLWVNGDDVICVGSIDELCKLANAKEIKDIHPEYVQNLKIIKNGKEYKIVNFVFDCWFESGCVPFAQHHYPFDSSYNPYFDKYEWIAEGIDQCRGWFYTTIVISTALFEISPVKTIICAGLVCDKDGKKFSKKNKNFEDPLLILDKYGADNCRLFLLSSPAVKAERVRFDQKEISEIIQKLIPWRSAIEFLICHGTNLLKNMKKYEISENNSIMDQWIKDEFNDLLINVRRQMDKYSIDTAIKLSLTFIDELTNWYIKINRNRLKGLMGLTDWENSIKTLLEVCLKYCSLLVPFTPFLSQSIYNKLKPLAPIYKISDKEDVNLCEYPVPYKSDGSKKEIINNFKTIIGLTREARNKSEKFKSNKTPLNKIIIISYDNKLAESMSQLNNLIMHEVNCLDIEYRHMQDFETLNIIFDNKSMGKKFRKDAAKIKDDLTKIDQKIIKDFYENKISEIIINNHIVTKDDIKIMPVCNIKLFGDNILSQSSESLTVAINTTYNKNSENLNNIRELLNQSQIMKKYTDLKPWNNVNLIFKTDSRIIFDTLTKYKDFIFEKLKFHPIIEITDDIEKPFESDNKDLVKSKMNYDDRDKQNIKSTYKWNSKIEKEVMYQINIVLKILQRQENIDP